MCIRDRGYEIHHGGRLGFRLRGQDRYQYPGRRDPLFTEDGILSLIHILLAAVQEGYTATGIEVTDTYAELARERIRKELACAA